MTTNDSKWQAVTANDNPGTVHCGIDLCRGIRKEADLDRYEQLANAIIIQACSDFRAAHRTLKDIENRSAWRKAKRQVLRDEKDRLMADKMLEDIEAFFRSGWFMDLTEMNGEYLLRRLNEEVRSYE